MAESPNLAPPPRTGPTGARARQRVETRERLFEAALREFREFGFAGAQIDRIAKAAGVVRGTFYFHFPSKDDVLVELARRINERVARRVSDIGRSETSLRDLLRRVNDAVMDEHARVGEAGLLAELLSLYVRRPLDLSLVPGQNSLNFGSEFVGHLDALRAKGGIPSSMPSELASIVFMTSLFGIYVRIPPGEQRRAACDALIDLLVAGLEVEDPPAATRLPTGNPTGGEAPRAPG